ncbi:hypothetical protein ACL9RI_27220 [Janthinobacterium sp. Mn2066]|uniref:hypothetical protein n=1 Tax=Janthinobacterium sp. Mn2066 TaxID=3395264 RepID=UPI003BC28248
MLTATYALVSLSVEQASIRVSLLAFQKYMHTQLHTQLRHQNQLTLVQWQYAADWLNRLYQSGYWRKVELYLIPAIRQATPHADGLIAELNHLQHAALESVNTVQQGAGAAINMSQQMEAQIEAQVEVLWASIDAFCQALLARLEKEERELFALARKVIVGEAWFAIAYQFLVHDARAEEDRRSKAQVLPFAAPKPVVPEVGTGLACRARA